MLTLPRRPAVFYSLVIAFQVALFVSVLNLWVPASPEALEDAEDMVLQLSTEGSAPAPSGHSEENPRYRRFKCAGLSTIEAPNPCTAAVGVQDRPVLVLVHGYGAGKALWTLNLDALAAHYRVYALDWLGCGLSDRPRFTAENPAEAEAFFTTAIEQWRDKMGVSRQVPSLALFLFPLCTHALPGPVASAPPATDRGLCAGGPLGGRHHRHLLLAALPQQGQAAGAGQPRGHGGPS